MKHVITVITIAAVCAGCSTSDRVPEGIVRSKADRQVVRVRMGTEQYFGKYTSMEIRQGTTFAAKRISAVALTTEEGLLTHLTVSVAGFPSAVHKALVEGGHIGIEGWREQDSTIMVGDHKYVHRAGERQVVVLSDDGKVMRLLPGQLGFEAFESKATLAQALSGRLGQSDEEGPATK